MRSVPAGEVEAPTCQLGAERVSMPAKGERGWEEAVVSRELVVRPAWRVAEGWR